MVHSELIDLLYENDAVEGVALFHHSGELVENQLAISEASVTQVCSCLVNINESLAAAGRTMQGFVIKNTKYLLQALLYNDLVILLQLTPSFSPEKTYQSINSQLGRASASAAVPVLQQRQEGTQETVTKEEEVASVLMVNWFEFQQQLSSLIKRVAPSGVATSMITTAIKDAEISADLAQIPLEKATEIGSAVVTKIPNASRRKIIEKEYQLLVKKFQPSA